MAPNITPQYLNESITDQLFAVAIAFIILDTVFFGLRIISRRYEPAKLGWNDILLVIGWINCIGQAADGLVALRFGSGLHVQKVVKDTPWLIPHWGRNNLYAYTILYIWAVTWPKLSILLLYLRVFTDKFSRFTCWALIVILTINPIINMFINLFECKAMSDAWDPKLSKTNCHDIKSHLAWASMINIISDAIMLVIPFPVIRRLQVARHVKIGISATFLLGSLGLFCAIFRFVAFYTIDYSVDGTWYAAPLLSWTIAEAGTYLISACLLSSKPLLVKMINSQPVSTVFSRFGTMKASTKGMNGYGNGQSHAANSRYGPDSRVQYMEQGRVRRDFETGRGKGESYSLDSSDQEGIRVERGFIVHNPRNDMV